MRLVWPVVVPEIYSICSMIALRCRHEYDFKKSNWRCAFKISKFSSRINGFNDII